MVGRPKSAHPLKVFSLRVDYDVLEKFRATGPGWRHRMSDVLRKSVAPEAFQRVSDPASEASELG
jgi:uncharacterized protein (DUF4415 family)